MTIESGILTASLLFMSTMNDISVICLTNHMNVDHTQASAIITELETTGLITEEDWTGQREITQEGRTSLQEGNEND